MQQHHTGSTGTLGKLCERNEHSYEWKDSQTPFFQKRGKFTPCKCDNFVPIVIPGLSKKIHLTSSEEESAESIKELTPDEQETTLASRSRLQDLPEWVKEFKENLVEPKPTSSDSDSRDPPEPPRPDPLPSAKPNGKHNLFTHFPKDPNCEICKRTKITRAACRRFSKSHPARSISVTFAQPTTRSPMKIENRGTNQRCVIIVQDLTTQRIQSYPCKTITSQGTTRNPRKFFDPEENPKVTNTDNSLEFGKALADPQWKHCASALHRSETNGIAEGAVRRVKEGTSTVLLQSGLGVNRTIPKVSRGVSVDRVSVRGALSLSKVSGCVSIQSVGEGTGVFPRCRGVSVPDSGEEGRGSFPDVGGVPTKNGPTK